MDNSINRVPSGLLSLLDTQTQGQNPNVLAQTVQPTIEISNWYALNKGLETEFSESTRLLSPGIADNPIIIPEAQMWAVYNVTAGLFSDEVVSNVVRFRATFQLSPLTANSVFFADTVNGCGVRSETGASVGWTSSMPMMFRSGCRFNLILDWTNIAPVGLGYLPSIAVTFCRLKI